jgi:hypothetical protein
VLASYTLLHPGVLDTEKEDSLGDLSNDGRILFVVSVAGISDLLLERTAVVIIKLNREKVRATPFNCLICVIEQCFIFVLSEVIYYEL